MLFPNYLFGYLKKKKTAIFFQFFHGMRINSFCLKKVESIPVLQCIPRESGENNEIASTQMPKCPILTETSSLRQATRKRILKRYSTAHLALL
jgi:hypothetical protein